MSKKFSFILQETPFSFNPFSNKFYTIFSASFYLFRQFLSIGYIGRSALSQEIFFRSTVRLYIFQFMVNYF